jgi:hypothetical protein
MNRLSVSGASSHTDELCRSKKDLSCYEVRTGGARADCEGTVVPRIGGTKQKDGLWLNGRERIRVPDSRRCEAAKIHAKQYPKVSL